MRSAVRATAITCLPRPLPAFASDTPAVNRRGTSITVSFSLSATSKWPDQRPYQLFLIQSHQNALSIFVNAKLLQCNCCRDCLCYYAEAAKITQTYKHLWLDLAWICALYKFCNNNNNNNKRASDIISVPMSLGVAAAFQLCFTARHFHDRQHSGPTVTHMRRQLVWHGAARFYPIFPSPPLLFPPLLPFPSPSFPFHPSLTSPSP